MFRVLLRASILLAVAPPVPVSWWPGARTLPESVLRRLPNGGARGADRGHVVTLHPSGARVVAIPIGGGRAVPLRESAVSAGAVVVAAPWGEPVIPFAGVTVSTCQVPRVWLRPETQRTDIIPMPVSRTVVTHAASRAATAAPSATITHLPRQPRTWPTTPAAIGRHGAHGRFRRAVTLALGLFVSLVAVEAAARSSRR